VQVHQVGRSKTSWRPVSRWTRVTITTTNDAEADTHVYTVDGLAVSSYYELEVRAFNDLDCSPAFRPPFIFFTHPGTFSVVQVVVYLGYCGGCCCCCYYYYYYYYKSTTSTNNNVV